MNGKIITGLGVAGVFACGWFSHEFFGGRSAAREAGRAAAPTVAVGEVALKGVNPVEWYIPFDATEYIRESIAETVGTLVLTFVLVALVCWLFLQNWRATLVPVAVIPVSVLSTFTVMAVLGYSVNILTMFGLILAIGTVVDDAIVVVERVQYLMERGLNAKEAAIQAMQDVTGAVMMTAFTFVLGILPMVWATGAGANARRSIGVTTLAGMLAATLVGVLLVPGLYVIFQRIGDWYERRV